MYLRHLSAASFLYTTLAKYPPTPSKAAVRVKLKGRETETRAGHSRKDLPRASRDLDLLSTV